MTNQYSCHSHHGHYDNTMDTTVRGRINDCAHECVITHRAAATLTKVRLSTTGSSDNIPVLCAWSRTQPKQAGSHQHGLYGTAPAAPGLVYALCWRTW